MGRGDGNSIPPADKSIVITSQNIDILQKIWDMGEFEKYFSSMTHWVRITILGGGKHDKDVVLRSVMNIMHPAWDFFPALYQVDGNDSFFLIRNGGMLIRKLGLCRLKVAHPSAKQEFDLSITTNYLSVSLETLNVTNTLRAAFHKRYNQLNRTLDLTNISEDSQLQDIYFQLNVIQCFHFVLEYVRSLPNIATLVLQHNDLRTLESLDLKFFPQLQELDIRHNNITWEGFKKFNFKKGSKLSSVWLDGNPLCINLTESDFVKRVSEVIPGVTTVDGVDVSSVSHGLVSLKNFMYDGSCSTFIDHFLYHYFMLMESPNRFQLSRMYHQKATFSLTASLDKDDSNSWSKMSSYTSNSRNLLTLSDITKAYSTLKTGPDEIIDVLNCLPVMHFDPDSFTVDVPVSQFNGLIMIDVGGVFQELNAGMFYFHRSFILTPFKKNSGEWKIENDMMSISPASPEITKKSFRTTRRPPSPKMLLKLNPGVKSREALIPAVCELTKLTTDFAIRFLEESSWDLEMTLQAFIDQLKSNQIPLHAFTI